MPKFPSKDAIEIIKGNNEINDEYKEKWIDWVKLILSQHIHIYKEEESKYSNYSILNLNLSECYNCHEVSIWVHDKLVFPKTKIEIRPNNDIPKEIIPDFEEAREIANISPRGAAALLRLCLQKLCKHLGEKGKSIDDDIGSLVKKGLSPIVQKYLDIVRVIGNEAVHPGVIDIKDDIQICMALFELVNSIAEQMITHPKKVKELFDKLPEEKRKAIERRDAE